MEIIDRVTKYYVTPNGKAPFKKWLDSLKDLRGRKLIQVKIDRLRVGNFSQCVSIGQGVSEARVFHGPGYRIYFGLHKGSLILLLMGGDKSSQESDIRKSLVYWEDFKRRTI
jgi:putative addiction module killer protein